MFSKEPYINEMMSIGETLRTKRIELNLTIDQAAEAAGLDKKNILAIENCEDIYNIQHLIIYAKSLNLYINVGGDLNVGAYL